MSLSLNLTLKSTSRELDTQPVPLTGCYRRLDAISTFAANNVEGAAFPVDGFIEYNIVFNRIGARNVMVVGIPCSPDKPTRLIFSSTNRFKPYLDKTIPDVDAILQRKRKGRSAGNDNALVQVKFCIHWSRTHQGRAADTRGPAEAIARSSCRLLAGIARNPEMPSALLLPRPPRFMTAAHGSRYICHHAGSLYRGGQTHATVLCHKSAWRQGTCSLRCSRRSAQSAFRVPIERVHSLLRIITGRVTNPRPSLSTEAPLAGGWFSFHRPQLGPSLKIHRRLWRGQAQPGWRIQCW
jgi:hypothetical protein